MSEIDEMALTAGSGGANASSSRKSTEIPLTASTLIEKSVDFLTAEAVSISRSSSISSSTSMGGMGNVGSNGKTGNIIIKTTTTSTQLQRQHYQSQCSASDAQSKSGVNMSPLNQPNNAIENGKSAKETNDKTDENILETKTTSSKNEESQLKSEAEVESENSTFYTPSASIQNLSGHQVAWDLTSGIRRSEADMNVSITSGDLVLEDLLLDTDSIGHFSNSQLSPDLNGSKSSVDSNFDGSCSLVNSMSSELTVSIDSTISKESSSSTSSQSMDKDAFLQPGVYNNTKLPTKKKMWYHVFQPSYKTRSSDFKKYFKDLPPEERLIVDYSCALQRDILVQGRMYVSQSYISFHANIFGWETLTCIRMKDVTSITKEKTALVIPNAVQVCTENEKFFFASFVTRDSTFMMLFKLWQTALLQEKTMPMKQVWQLVHSCYGEIGSEEEDEDYLSVSRVPENHNDIPSMLSAENSTANNDEKANKSIEIDEVGDDHPLLVSDHAIPRSTTSTLKAVVNGHSSGAADTDSSDSEVEILHVPVEDLYIEIPVCPTPHNQGVEVVNAVIPCDVDQLFTMLFTKSKFYLDFHTKRKTFNIVQGDWEQNLGETKKVRQVSFTVTLNNAMGPKHSQVTETQVLLPESKPGCLYAIDAESVNAGIPYEDSFYVTCHFCLSRVSPQETKLVIISQVKYKKSVSWMIKPFIEKNSWAGIKEFYSHLEQAVKEECAKVIVSTHSPVPSVRVSGPTVVRRRKYKAPAPPSSSSISANANENVPNNGSIPLSADDEIGGSQLIGSSSLTFKATMAILTSLLLLNAYLFVKLIRLETAANTPTIFQTPPVFTKELPQNHQDWLLLLQHQEALHRIELQKWHEVLMAALQILHQAEADLELLTLRISSYGERRLNIIGMKGNPDFTENPDVPIPAQEKRTQQESKQETRSKDKLFASSLNLNT